MSSHYHRQHSHRIHHLHSAAPLPTPGGVSRHAHLLSLEDRKKLDWIWHKRMELKLQLNEVMTEMEACDRHLEAILQQQYTLDQRRPQVIVGILFSARVQSVQELAYHRERHWLCQQELQVRAHWQQASLRWSMIQQSLRDLDAEEEAIKNDTSSSFSNGTLLSQP